MRNESRGSRNLLGHIPLGEKMEIRIFGFFFFFFFNFIT